MLARLLVLSLVCAGCSGKSEAPTAGSADAEKLGFPFIPEPIAHQLGDANVIMAVDLGKFELARFSALVPDELGCVRELLGKVGVVVIGAGAAWQGHVTGMPEDATRKCIDALVPLLGAKTEPMGSGFRLLVGGDKYRLTWKGGTVEIYDEARPVKGAAPSARMRALVAQVPKDAEGWVVSGGFPKFKITSSVAWIKTAPGHWNLVVTAEAAEPGIALPWTQDIVKGFKEGAAQKGVVVEDAWFKVTGSGNTARLEAEIPSDIFTRAE